MQYRIDGSDQGMYDRGNGEKWTNLRITMEIKPELDNQLDSKGINWLLGDRDCLYLGQMEQLSSALYVARSPAGNPGHTLKETADTNHDGSEQAPSQATSVNTPLTRTSHMDEIRIKGEENRLNLLMGESTI